MTYALNYANPTVYTAGRRTRAVRFGDRFMYLLGFLLLGYALGGRGFAYWGFKPVFVGELTLTMGVIAFCRSGQFLRVMKMTILAPLLMFAILGAMRTIPYWELYKFECIRDAAIWGFSAFAFILVGLFIARPERLALVERFYRKFCVIFLCCAPLVWLFNTLFEGSIPNFPLGDVPLIQVKGGDLCVHLSGAFGFIVAMGSSINPWIAPLLVPLNLALNLQGRAGLMSFLTASVMCVVLRPFHHRAMKVFGTMVLGFVLLWAADLHLNNHGDGREISAEFIKKSLHSVFSESDDPVLRGSKEWRLRWWTKIINYTVYGQYFWTGKGFGIDLAEDDGFKVDEFLRSPHNGHMTILAREGVPGIVLWATIHLTWLGAMANSYVRSRIKRDWKWSGLFLFLMVYYAAFLTNASFDVFIEGPMGGIWMWSVYGTGVAAMYIFKRNPEVLYIEPPVKAKKGKRKPADQMYILQPTPQMPTPQITPF
jgi:hypothetical protein